MKIVVILVLLLGPSVAIAENCICDDISHIKTLPIKDERVKDDTYNKLISDASQSKSCLVESITDATLKRDPRQAPFYVGTTVGDVALFVLLDIEKSINLKDVLPEAIQNEYENNGVYTYFSFVQKQGNRVLIQKRVKELLSMD